MPRSCTCIYQLNCRNFSILPSYICAHSDIAIKNVTLWGTGIYIQSRASTICDIKQCSFQSSLGCGLRIDRIEDSSIRPAIISNCNFSQCSLLSEYVIEFKTPVSNDNYIEFLNNTVSRYPTGIVNYKNVDGCVRVYGNTIIKDNVIFNTPRCHIYIGSGIVKVQKNYMYNTDSFNKKEERNLSNDMGIIYCNHVYSDELEALRNNTHHILIEDNLLYGSYAYGGDARGVFIDNGRGDVECKNNIIINTQLYSIDARNTFQNAASVRNRYEGNAVTTKYRLAAGSSIKGGDKPVTKKNYVLNNEINNVNNIQVEVMDITSSAVTTCYESGGKIIMDRHLYKVVRRNSIWKNVRNYVKKKKD